MKVWLRQCRQTGGGRSGRGFTLVEILVAVVVLSVGLLGMAMMTVMVIRGNRMAVRQTHATGLAQQLMEQLKGVDFNVLGTNTFVVGNGVDVGDLNAVSYETGLNSQREDSGVVGADPPFIYNLFLRVCDDTMGPETPNASSTENCDPTKIGSPSSGTNPSKWSEHLHCLNDLNPGEKKLRILVSWYRYDGFCRTVPMETIVVDTL